MVKTRKIDLTIESLRGFAALIVVFHHLSWDATLDPGFSTRSVVNYMPPGHLFVLVFFMLSGYVIGLTNPQDSLKFETKNYLWKRFLRIYPIYLIAIFISVIPGEYNLTSLAGALLFLQNAITPNLTTNPPLWSLNHEIVYYLLFIPIIKYRLNIWMMAGIAFLAGISPLFIAAPAQLSAYGIGFFFWLTGLWMAWKTQQSDITVSFNRLISILFLMLCVHVFNVLTIVVDKLNLVLPKGEYMQNIVNVKDLVEFPICFAAMLLFTGRYTRYKPFWVSLAYLLPAINIIYLMLKQNIWEVDFLFAPFCFFTISILFLAVPKINLNVEKAAIAGSISYALYVIHMPILFLFKKIALFSGTVITFSIRLCLYLALVFLISYFLEKIFQPFIRQLIDRKNRKPEGIMQQTMPGL